LAAISNDPSAELHPELTEEVNFQTTVCLAEAAKAKGSVPVFFLVLGLWRGRTAI